MEEKNYLTPEEQLQELSNTLVGSILQNSELAQVNRRCLFGQFSPKVFKDENFILVSVFHDFKDKGFVPDKEFLEMHLTMNAKLFKDNQDSINLKQYSDLDENPVLGYASAVLKHYSRLIQNEVLSNEDFKLVMEKYKVAFSAYEVGKAYSEAKIILYDGIQVGRRFYQGMEDSVAYVKNKVAIVESMLSKTVGEGFIDSRVEGIVEDDSETKPVKIGDFGLIHQLNNRLGGIFTSLFYNIIAPTKGGKSKFCSRLAHIMMVEYGTNISVWAHEGGYKAFWAQLRAIHFEYMYIRNKDDGKKIAPLSQDDILRGNYPSEEIKSLEEASRIDLFTNPNYGCLGMIDRPFKTESFLDEIETSVQLNDSKAIIIDYLQLIASDVIHSKPEAIGRAYQTFLAYLKKRNIAGISPSQFKQDSINEVAKAKGNGSVDLRTAGGESSEIIRTPDINIALYATPEDIIRHEMSILSIPSRLCEPFPEIKLYADFCSCVFSSMDAEEE